MTSHCNVKYKTELGNQEISLKPLAKKSLQKFMLRIIFENSSWMSPMHINYRTQLCIRNVWNYTFSNLNMQTQMLLLNNIMLQGLLSTRIPGFRFRKPIWWKRRWTQNCTWTYLISISVGKQKYFIRIYIINILSRTQTLLSHSMKRQK